ncbi:MAG TPA: histone deacetylase [Acidimicrobiales bacterium]|nr:histone deacetylase [Acidimicrobiales bacterium]
MPVTPLVLAGPVGLTEHDGGARHPEQPARLAAVMDGVHALGLGDALLELPARAATGEELRRVHAASYLREVESFCAAGGGDIDPDTYARPDSWDAATRAAGAGVDALVELERLGEGVAFVPVRPPGHHATDVSAMGFCLVNNVAVAAASRTARGERVLVVDWDVHHGNGTQAIFWDDPQVLYVSTHQHPLYPGTGAAAEVGGAGASGLTLNLPLPPGATGDIVRAALDVEARETVEAFAPDWVLVSAGFDAHRADPLSNLELSGEDFAELARVVRTFAPRPGRLALFLEGGYDLAALRSSVEATLTALLDLGTPGTRGNTTSGGPGRRELESARAERGRALDNPERPPAS